MTKYLGIAIVVLLLACVALFYRGQVYVAKYKAEKAEVARLTVSNNGLEETIVRERKNKEKAIEFYQEKLRECLEKPDCIEVVIEGCPEIQIIKEDEDDSLLIKLKNMWR